MPIPRAANKATKQIIPKTEMHNPAMASPRGCLDKPMQEKIRPNAHRIHPKTGIHPKIKVTNDNTKPVTPIALPFFACPGIGGVTCSIIILF